MELAKRVLHVQEGEEVFVAPLGDIQWTGRPGDVSVTALQAHLRYTESKHAWYVGTGDYGDGMSPSNRAKLRASGLYDNTDRSIQDKMREVIDDLYVKILKPTTNRWLGLVHGHHYADVGEGYTTDTWLAQKLGCSYLGSCAYVHLVFHGPGARRGSLNLWVHHGTGSGRAGAALNKLEVLATNWEANVFIMGHTTKLSVAPISRIYPRFKSGEVELRHKKIYLINAGGWSKAYALGSQRDARPGGDYAELAMMAPAALGGSLLKITCHWSGCAWEPEIKVEI